jgi:hypothetical protein
MKLEVYLYKVGRMQLAGSSSILIPRRMFLWAQKNGRTSFLWGKRYSIRPFDRGKQRELTTCTLDMRGQGTLARMQWKWQDDARSG